MKSASAAIEPSKPVATMIAPKTKKVSTWKIALTFSEKSTKRSVISCSKKPSVIAGDEGGDQPVAEGDVGEAERGEAEADRVDALVAGVTPPGTTRCSHARQHPERDPDHGPERRLAEQLDRLRAGVAARRREDEEEEHEGKREPVVEPGLEVERVADRRRDPLRGDHHRGDHRIGRRQHRAEQEGLGPARARRTAASRRPPAGRG